MVNSCCVYGCYNKYNVMNKTITFHKFPDRQRKPNLHREWSIKIKRDNFVPSKHTKVCSDHFSESEFEPSCKYKVDFITHTSTGRYLKDIAVTSIK